jgi:hypothetical protein
LHKSVAVGQRSNPKGSSFQNLTSEGSLRTESRKRETKRSETGKSASIEEKDMKRDGRYRGKEKDDKKQRMTDAR